MTRDYPTGLWGHAHGAGAAGTIGAVMDKRKKRRTFRRMARDLINTGTLLNAKAPIGSTLWHVTR